MQDPWSDLGTAFASGVGGELAKGLVAPLSTWLRERFGKHTKVAQAKMIANIYDFVTELAPRLERLEENISIREQIDAISEQPDFIIQFQRAFESVARTDLHDKRVILAQLVTTRLQTPDEDSTLALISSMACEAVANMTSNQLKLLGLHYTLVHLQHPPSVEGMHPEVATRIALEWMEAVLGRTAIRRESSWTAYTSMRWAAFQVKRDSLRVPASRTT